MEHRFRRQFERDFDAATIDGPPYALARFGDGERLMLQREPIVNADGWHATEIAPWLYDGLWDAYQHDAPDYWLGISCPCCDPEGHAWLLENARTRRLTFSNLFVNANYDRFLYRLIREAWLQRCTLVGHYPSAHVRLPPQAVNDKRFSLDGVLDKLLKSDKPILVAGGPIANVLIYRYWKEAPRKQIILDIGSTLDPVFGRLSRGYHRANHPNRSKVCVWSR